VILGVVLVLVGVWLRRSDRLDAHLRDEQVTRRLRGRSEMEAELRQAQADTPAAARWARPRGQAAAEALLGREQAHVAAIEHATARLEGLLGGEVADDLTDRRDASALEVEQKTSAIDALGPIAKEPRARERLEVEVAEAERAMERARDDEAAARARVEQNQVDAEAVASLAEEAAAQDERLSELRRRARVYRTTRDAIETAEKATMQTATRYLERRMVGDLERITGGRYRRVRVDDTNLGIEVWRLSAMTGSPSPTCRRGRSTSSISPPGSGSCGW
jgi:chemotaxis regulatin CheY-phosphate phosphatase CheZ